MSSYIKSEFYRLLRNKWTYLFVMICSLLMISSNIVLAAVNYAEINFSYATTRFSLANLYSSLSMVFILCIMVASMVFGNEHSNHTMKNSVSYGISRSTIYFGKLIVEITYALVSFVIITGLHTISAYVLLENSGPGEVELLLRNCFVCLPLLLFALATTNCFLFIIEATGGGIAAITGLLIALPLVSNLLGMKFRFFYNLSRVLPWNMINEIGVDSDTRSLLLYWEGAAGYRNYWLIGILQMIIVSLIGYIIFQKKEIK